MFTSVYAFTNWWNDNEQWCHFGRMTVKNSVDATTSEAVLLESIIQNDTMAVLDTHWRRFSVIQIKTRYSSNDCIGIYLKIYIQVSFLKELQALKLCRNICIGLKFHLLICILGKKNKKILELPKTLFSIYQNYCT